MYRILLIDDEPNVLKSLSRLMKRNSNWEVECFSDPHAALHRAETTSFDLFFSDYRMPVMDGVEFLKQTKSLQPEAMRIILSGYADMEGLMGAINEAEIYRFLVKPWQDLDVIFTVQQALAARDYLTENRRLADQVRQQQQELDKHKSALEVLEKQHPGLTKVNWAEDGSIILDEGDVS